MYFVAELDLEWEVCIKEKRLTFTAYAAVLGDVRQGRSVVEFLAQTMRCDDNSSAYNENGNVACRLGTHRSSRLSSRPCRSLIQCQRALPTARVRPVRADPPLLHSCSRFAGSRTRPLLIQFAVRFRFTQISPPRHTNGIDNRRTAVVDKSARYAGATGNVSFVLCMILAERYYDTLSCCRLTLLRGLNLSTKYFTSYFSLTMLLGCEENSAKLVATVFPTESWFSTNIFIYLGNGTRYAIVAMEVKRIGTCMRAIEW